MEALKEEIARKKRQMEEKDILVPDKKYFKRGDLAARDTEEYWRKHKRLVTQTHDEGSNPGAGEQGEEATKREPTEEEKKKAVLPRKEVIRRLRERGEPIRLFGEGDYETFQRLRKLEMLEPEVNKGFQNDFQDAMDRVDQDELNEMLKSTGAVVEGTADDAKGADVKVKSDGTTYEEIMQLRDKFGKGDEALDCDVILKFLKHVLNVWGHELNARSEEVKRTMKGKYVSATHMQTVSYIKPLFRKLKRQEVQTDILGCLVDIAGHLLDRQYLKANEAYLEMAIGNAPWPIGVTMVGIHARTGREKIFARNVAHVLNDETQRKYIQGLKRLMTQAQKYFPTDPSMCVNYEAPK